jgi:hypothetical protein
MDWLLWIAIIVLILLPPSFDPAIRIKMRQVMRGDHPESRDTEWIVWCRFPDHKGLFYMTIKGWSRNRDKAARFNTAQIAAETLKGFPEHMKWRTGIEIA